MVALALAPLEELPKRKKLSRALAHHENSDNAFAHHRGIDSETSPT
jgi:hypothetical protein